MARDELAHVSSTELAARIRRGEVSPVEVVNAAIERTEARNEPYDTYTLLQANAT